jgi:hypothetical protein
VDAFLSQLPALLGVLVGTLGTILATYVTERARWSRAKSVRWDERRLDAYAEYARALKSVSLLAMRLYAATDPTWPSTPLDRETGLPLLVEAQAERSKAWERVLLLGDAATVDAAREWSDAVRALSSVVRRPDSRLDWEAAVRDLDRCRDRFYEAARGGLTVGGGTVAQAAWLADRHDGS